MSEPVNRGLLSFQLSVLTGVRYLQTSLENVLRQGDPNSESDGWLLENSFMETARMNLNIIKSLGKGNQIDTATNGDPNINVPSTSKAHYGPDNVPPKQITEDSWTFSLKRLQWTTFLKPTKGLETYTHYIGEFLSLYLWRRNGHFVCGKYIWTLNDRILISTP